MFNNPIQASQASTRQCERTATAAMHDSVLLLHVCWLHPKGNPKPSIFRRMSRLLETWCLMEYAEKGSLADALRTGRLRRQNGFPELGVIIACLQDIASGRATAQLACLDDTLSTWAPNLTSYDVFGSLCKVGQLLQNRLLWLY